MKKQMKEPDGVISVYGLFDHKTSFFVVNHKPHSASIVKREILRGFDILMHSDLLLQYEMKLV